MASEHFEIAYAAHTASCTFLLDAEGICRRIVMQPNNHRREHARNAQRCVGGQYVASLDAAAPGCLVEMPRVGATMLFARVDERGRVALVRTGAVTSFESKKNEDPFADSGAVETSVPEFFTPGGVPVAAAEHASEEDVDGPLGEDDDISIHVSSEEELEEEDDRTLTRRPPAASKVAYRPEARARVEERRTAEVDEDEPETEQLRTAQYRASGRPTRRNENRLAPPAMPVRGRTLRESPLEGDDETEDDDPYNRRTLPPPRLSEPARPRHGHAANRGIPAIPPVAPVRHADVWGRVAGDAYEARGDRRRR